MVPLRPKGFGGDFAPIVHVTFDGVLGRDPFNGWKTEPVNGETGRLQGVGETVGGLPSVDAAIRDSGVDLPVEVFGNVKADSGDGDDGRRSSCVVDPFKPRRRRDEAGRDKGTVWIRRSVGDAARGVVEWERWSSKSTLRGVIERGMTGEFAIARDIGDFELEV